MKSKKSLKAEKKEAWHKLPIAGLILEPGTSKNYETGDWRSICPVWDKEKCIHCLSCWIYCPDAAIKVKEGKIVGIDLKYCKGCGICAKVCPAKVKAITMKKE